VTDKDGNVFGLLKVRNPHMFEYNYNGTWAEKNDIWKNIGLDGRTFAQ